jgi:hypothetical protein
MSNETKLASMRALNIRQGLPLQEPDDTIWNGAFFGNTNLVQDLFIVPRYTFTQHPSSDHPQAQQHQLIREYGILLARVNLPRLTSSALRIYNQANFL